MKSIKELLQLMLSNTHRCFAGLCALANVLVNCEIITDGEYAILLKYIQDNSPTGDIAVYSKGCFNTWYHVAGYWYPRYIKEPRIKWLKEHIELNN